MGLLKLTESERLEILNLHNNARIIKEQVPVVGTQQTPMDDTAKIKAIQTALNTKYKSNLKVDGILGTNTLTSLSTAMKSKTAPVVKEPVVEPVKTDVKPGTTVVEPVVQEPVVQEPVVQEPVVQEPVVQAAPLSNRDQRRERQDLRRSNRRDIQNLRAGQQGQQQ